MYTAMNSLNHKNKFDDKLKTVLERCFLRQVLNRDVHCRVLRWRGREFHSFGAGNAKLQPYDTVLPGVSCMSCIG